MQAEKNELKPVGKIQNLLYEISAKTEIVISLILKSVHSTYKCNF